MKNWFSATMMAFVGIGSVWGFNCNHPKEEVQIKPPPRIRVQTDSVQTKMVPSFLRVTGTIEAFYKTNLAANANGKVLTVSMQDGEEVKKGALLAKLDIRLVGLQAETARAQAVVSNHQAELQAQECERLSKLAATESVARADYEKQLAQCKISRSALLVSKLQASVAAQAVVDGNIRAPFDGFIVDHFIEAGEYVTPNTKVATIVSLQPLKLKIFVPEVNLPQIHKDLMVTFRVQPYQERSFSAKLVHISPVVRSATRDVVVEAEVENKEMLLRPGMFATVELPLGETQLPVVLKNSVVSRDESKHLFVVQSGRIEERVVQLGPEQDGVVAVIKGISAGEQVVRAPGPDVKNGFLVE